MKKLFMAAILLGLLGMILVFHWNAAEVEANDSMKMNERKYFTSYVVEKDDTLWDIAERFQRRNIHRSIVTLKKLWKATIWNVQKSKRDSC